MSRKPARTASAQSSPRKSSKGRSSARFISAAHRNLEKAWEASRRHWEKTPARRETSRRNIKAAQAANRRRPRKISEAQRTALRRNMAKARATLNARGRSPEHIAKLREGIVRARAARTPQGRFERAKKILSHGFYSRLLRHTPMGQLGEDPADYEKIQALLARYFEPRPGQETDLVKAIANALWRFHRLYFAQAKQQLTALLFYLNESPPFHKSYDQAFDFHAYALLNVMVDQRVWQRRERSMLGTIERLLRRLVRARAGRPVPWKTNFYGPHIKRREQPTESELRSKRFDRLLDKLQTGEPLDIEDVI